MAKREIDGVIKDWGERADYGRVQGVKIRTETEGCSPTRWIVNCVRASLAHEPKRIVCGD